MTIEDLKCCPFCGGKEFYEKQYATGFIYYRMRFDGKEANNEQMYDQLKITYSGRIYCEHCNRYLGNIIENTLSKAVLKKLTTLC